MTNRLSWINVALPALALAAGELSNAWGADAGAAVEAPGVAHSATLDALYFWIDESYQSIGLPNYDLGWKHIDGAGASVPNESFHTRAGGTGISAAVGYLFPDGTLWPQFGSDARLELSGFYTKADANQSGAATAAGGQLGIGLLAGGNPTQNIACGICTTESTLRTSYSGWQIDAKGASEYRFGMLSLKPSFSLFGAGTNSDQTLSQLVLTNVLVAGYDVQSALFWQDWGAKAGLDARLRLGSALAIGLGGNVGVATRHVSLSASDLDANLASPPTLSSSIAQGLSTTPFLANLEATLAGSPAPGVGLKAFVGLNYDTRVPGLAAPSFLGPTGPPVGSAGIKLEAETSYYAGGGLTIKF